MAEVTAVTTRRMRNRPGTVLEAVVTDGRDRLTLTFFNQAWREKELRPGRRGLFAGKVSRFRTTWQLAHPEYLLLPDDDVADGAAASDGDAALFARGLIPVYPASASVPSWKVAQSVRLALDVLDAPEDVDPLPAALRERHHLQGLRDALRSVHQPHDRAEVERARTRLRWDEALVLQTVLAQRRLAAAAAPAVPRTPRPGGLLDAFDARLPFTLTAGQREVGEQIAADLALPHPMHRLLQGEVGSGKTLVALRAMLAVVDAGGQAVLLAPTEVLAQQHHRSLTALLGPLAERGLLGGADVGTRVALLTGSRHRHPSPRDAAGAGLGRGGHRRRDARPARGPGAAVRPRPGRRRRAAPLRRGAAGGAGGEVARRQPTPRARHDGDAHPAHRGHDRVRRPRGLDPHRAARRAGLPSPPTWSRPWSGRRSCSGPGAGSGRRWRRDVRRTWSARASGVTTRGPTTTCRSLPVRRRRPGRDDGGRMTTAQAVRAARGGPRSRCSIWCRCSSRARWPGCASGSSTGGCRPTRRTTSCGGSPPAPHRTGSTCSSPPR